MRKNRAADSQHGWLQLWMGMETPPEVQTLGRSWLWDSKSQIVAELKRENHPITSAHQIHVFLSCVEGLQFRLCVDHRAYAAIAQQLSLSSQKLNFLLVCHYLKLHFNILWSFQF